MESPGDRPLLRIGELSRRLGVTDHVLRAWESRYGLLQPVRSAGGFRLYSAADEWRIRQMQAHLAEGLSAAEAARTVLREDGSASAEPAPPAGPGLAAATVGGLAAALRQALDAFDEPSAQAVFDRLVSDLSLTAVLRDVVLPLPRRPGRTLAARDGQHRPGALRQQHHPRPSRGPGPWLGRRPRAARHPRLPARGAARYGADDFRHSAQPQRVEHRLLRDKHPGRGTGAGR